MISLKNPSLFSEATLVAGKWIAPAEGDAVPVNNPATGEIIGHVPNLGQSETNAAIEAAETARHAWAARTAKDRNRRRLQVIVERL